MADNYVEALLRKHSLVSDQVDISELRIILRELSAQLTTDTPGSVVELGCYIGTTSLFIRRLLDIYQTDHTFHVYDSFSGLPPKSDKDTSPAGEHFKTGELTASRKSFELQFKKSHLRPPVIHKGWFSELTAKDIPKNIVFAYLDGDYYESIRDSFHIIGPNLAPGACIVVDDYVNEALPGAAKAVDEWLRSHTASLRVQSSLAIIRPTRAT